MHRDEFLGSMWNDGLALADAAEAAGLDARVPSCPEWSVADLVWHIGEVHEFWGQVVEGGITDPNAYVEPERPDDDAALLEWYRNGVSRWVQVLTDAEPEREIWTWTSRSDAAWVVRRMAQETAVHRWDAEAAAGREWSIDPALAVDGVDEFFEFFSSAPAKDAEPIGGTVHLHCTDANGEWLVSEPDPAGPVEVAREHAKGDAAVRGTASDLLLLLWRRVALDAPSRYEVFGDAGVADRLIRRADLR